jgi:hypothetical protein
MDADPAMTSGVLPFADPGYRDTPARRADLLAFLRGGH